MNIIKEIKLDLSQETAQEYIFAKCGDSKSRYLSVALLDQGKPFSIPAGTKARIQVRIQNGAQSVSDCKIEGNKVIAELTQGILSASGKAEAEIVLQSASGEILSTELFFLNIQSYSIDAGKIAGTDEYGALTKALVQVDQAGEIAQTAKVNAEEALRNLAYMESSIEEAVESARDAVRTFAIKRTVDGELISVQDSAQWKPLQLVLKGKSEQVQTEQGKNLCPPMQIQEGISGSDGSFVRNNTARRTPYIPVKSETAYVISQLPDDLYTLIAWYDADKNYIGRTNANTAIKKNFTTPAGTVYISIAAYENPETTGVIRDVYPMLVEGTAENSYEPFVPECPSPEYPSAMTTYHSSNFSVYDKNLFDVEEFIRLVQLYDSTSQIVTVNGRRCIEFNNWTLYKQNFSSVFNSFHSNTQYTLTMTAKALEQTDSHNYLIVGYIWSTENYKEINIADHTAEQIRFSTTAADFVTAAVTLQPGRTATQIGFSYGNRSRYYIDLDSIQLEVGTQSTEIAQYTHREITINNDRPLLGLPDGTCDKLYMDFTEKKAWRLNKCNRIILTGKEEFYRYENTDTAWCYRYERIDILRPAHNEALPNLYCSHMRQESRTKQKENLEKCSVSAFTNSSMIALYTKEHRGGDVEGFKKWLSSCYANGSPVVIDYPLAISEIVALSWDPSWNKLQMHYGDNLMFCFPQTQIQLTYCADTALRFKELENVVAALQETR